MATRYVECVSIYQHLNLCTILSVLATSYNLKLITGWEELFYSFAENVVSEYWDRIVDRKNSQRLMTLSWVIG